MPDVGCRIPGSSYEADGSLPADARTGPLRPAEGKKDAIVLDHSGAVFKLGFPEDRIEWTLDPDKGAKNRTHDRRESGGDRIVECSMCGAAREGGKPCPHCGFLPVRKAVGSSRGRAISVSLIATERFKHRPTTGNNGTRC